MALNNTSRPVSRGSSSQRQIQGHGHPIMLHTSTLASSLNRQANNAWRAAQKAEQRRAEAEVKLVESTLRGHPYLVWKPSLITMVLQEKQFNTYWTCFILHRISLRRQRRPCPNRPTSTERCCHGRCSESVENLPQEWQRRNCYFKELAIMHSTYAQGHTGGVSPLSQGAVDLALAASLEVCQEFPDDFQQAKQLY